VRPESSHHERRHVTSNRIALVAGATQGLGLALVGGLARRLDLDDVVYLTGRSQRRMDVGLASVTGARVESPHREVRRCRRGRRTPGSPRLCMTATAASTWS
jgi:NAD(P)-dependent dehydrogenase (short-subunit alcohol dehydrogenase family)